MVHIFQIGHGMGTVLRDLLSYVTFLFRSLEGSHMTVSTVLLKNFHIGHNFQTRRCKAFILYMCIPCHKTFHIVL